MGDQGNQPVIIKRKKVIAGGGHHGGAWKVAYADFVTAMMAFFMLMWLLNATTEKQRKGIADYFNPTIPIHRVSGGGDGALGGDSIFTEETYAYNGTGASSTHAFRSPVTTPPSKNAKAGSVEELQKALQAQAAEGSQGALTDHIALRSTDEGLVIEIFSRPGAPLFTEPSNKPTRLLQTLVGLVVQVADPLKNPIAIETHSRAFPVVLENNPAWSLTRDRAEHLRTLIEENLAHERIARLTSHGQRQPAAPNKTSLRNDRVELILLRLDQAD